MLTADQIDALGLKAQQITEPITEFLIRDIARRISEAGQLTSTAAYQVWKLQKLGISQRKLKEEIRKRLNISLSQVEKLMTQTAEIGYRFDLDRLPHVDAVPFAKNSTIQEIVDAAVQMAREDLSNMVQTMGFVGPNGKALPLTQAYEQACDFAFQKVATGAQDYNSAIRGATRELAKRGIVTIDYATGRTRSLEAAVRGNVMGAMGTMQEKISRQNHDDFGCNGWEISAHANSAPDHEPIQGRQYTDEEYTRLNNSLVRRIGTLNCGHSAFPIIIGINSPQYTPEQLEKFRKENEEGFTYEGKHYTGYESTQRQRKLERAIRDRKHRILIDEAAGDKEQLAIDQTKLTRLNDEYARFTKAAGLRSQRERGNVAGFGRQQAATARKVARPVIEFDNEHIAKDPSELLPKYNQAAIPDGKLSGYALNMEHPVGKNKAIVFDSVLGYNISNQDVLVQRVRDGLGKYCAFPRAATKYGLQFSVPMMILGINGRYAPVITAWQIDAGTDTPRLVSIYVDK